jgi:hypothetical protein
MRGAGLAVRVLACSRRRLGPWKRKAAAASGSRTAASCCGAYASWNGMILAELAAGVPQLARYRVNHYSVCVHSFTSWQSAQPPGPHRAAGAGAGPWRCPWSPVFPPPPALAASVPQQQPVTTGAARCAIRQLQSQAIDQKSYE